MKTQFTVCGSWSHVRDVVGGFQFHDISRFSESAGYVELRRNANDRGHAHGADIRVVVCGEPGKHAYARDAYKRATRNYSPGPQEVLRVAVARYNRTCAVIRMQFSHSYAK